jgi:hypothetical protein
MKKLLTKFALVIGIVPLVWAVCDPDFSGLSGVNAFDQTASTTYTGLPLGYVDATGARTTDDFVTTVANQLFFTPEGSRFLAEVFNWAHGFPGFAARGYGNPPPISISGYACNEIGQCRDTTTLVSFSGHDDSLFDAVLKFFSGGLIDDVNVKFQPEAYTITASGYDGTITDPRDFINHSIRQQAFDEDLYDLSTDAVENIDTDCRDNSGKVVRSTSETTGGDAGGDGSVDLDWDFDLDPPEQEWDCWADETGVVCRKRSK